jgi:phosphoglycolate phosphatase-like HAD superfamily hydrolase
MAGRTDQHIFQATLEAHGLKLDRDGFGRFSALLAEGYASGGDLLRRHGLALPGAAAAGAALAARPGVVQSVLTGNIRPVAAAKLAAFGLDRHVDLSIGAYGSDDAAREKLVAIARRRAGAKHRRRFPAAATVLIGDTPHDVTAARLAGAAVVAVATGHASVDELRAAGADVVLPDLADTEAFLRAALRGGEAEPTATSPTAG